MEGAADRATFAGQRQSLPPLRRLLAYARLSNLSIYFHWIPAIVGWSLLGDPLGLDPRSWLSLLVFVLGVIAMACSSGALDDVQGIRDGIDQRTYGPDDALRRAKAKPIVLGEISERDAFRYAIAMGVLGLSLGLVAILLSPHRAPLMAVAWIGFALLATQYSYGLKVSYRGFGEVLLGVEAAGVAIAPLFLLEGHADGTAWVQAYLTGTWFAQVTVFSSSHDAEIDREAQRYTLAAALSPAANRAYISAVFLAGWAVIVAGVETGSLGGWELLALAPTLLIGVAQLYYGLRRELWLRARFLGWRAFEIGVVTLVVVNLLTG